MTRMTPEQLDAARGLVQQAKAEHEHLKGIPRWDQIGRENAFASIDNMNAGLAELVPALLAEVAALQAERDAARDVLNKVYATSRLALDDLNGRYEQADMQHPFYPAVMALAFVSMDAGSYLTGRNLMAEALDKAVENVMQTGSSDE